MRLGLRPDDPKVVGCFLFAGGCDGHLIPGHPVTGHAGLTPRTYHDYVAGIAGGPVGKEPG